METKKEGKSLCHSKAISFPNSGTFHKGGPFSPDLADLLQGWLLLLLLLLGVTVQGNYVAE